MRAISFALTTQQILNRTKTVTRRIGWGNATPGQLLCACTKARGVRVADREILATIRIVSMRKERLDAIKPDDVAREGFPGKTPAEFVEMFCKHMKCAPDRIITRLEFEYED